MTDQQTKPYTDKEWEQAVEIVELAEAIATHFCRQNKLAGSEQLGVFLHVGIPVACTIKGGKQ